MLVAVESRVHGTSVLSPVAGSTMFREARPNKSCDTLDGQGSLPPTINAFTFPAKLWRMVSNPQSDAVRWSDSGEVIFIDRQMFETQILAGQSRPSENLDTFRAKHFTSFIRQLNLYGFSRASWVRREEGVPYPFFHPNFRRGHPELLAHLERRTVKNKNKWKAGLSVPSKLQGRPRREFEHDMLLLPGENRPDPSPDRGPTSQGGAVDTQRMGADTDNDGVMAPGSSALAAQQATQCYSSCSFSPPTYSELFSPQWSTYNFGDQCCIHPSHPSSYLQLHPPVPYFHQGQYAARSARYYETPPFPAHLQRPLNMADTSVYSASLSDLTCGLLERPPPHALWLPDLSPLDMTEVIADEDLVSEVAGMGSSLLS